MTTAKQTIESSIKQIGDYVKHMTQEIVKLSVYVDQLDRVLAQFEESHSINVMQSSGKFLVRVPVAKMDEVVPVIEAIESEFGIEFDKTEDVADYGWRLFKCKDHDWIRVDAEVKQGSEECRKVIVAYETKQVPVYEIKCGEDAAQPDAQKPTEIETV
jgi:hypothetical protein